jgi:hypothetical protein
MISKITRHTLQQQQQQHLTLNGPMALLNCTRKPRLICTLPVSSIHGTLHRAVQDKQAAAPAAAGALF